MVNSTLVSSSQVGGAGGSSQRVGMVHQAQWGARPSMHACAQHSSCQHHYHTITPPTNPTHPPWLPPCLQLVDCICEGVLPWPHCDALLHLAMDEIWSTQLPGLQAALGQAAHGMAAAAPGPTPGRRGSGMGTHRGHGGKTRHGGRHSTAAGSNTGGPLLPHSRKLQQYAYCDGFPTLPQFDAASGGCIYAYCKAGLYAVGYVYGQIDVSAAVKRMQMCGLIGAWQPPGLQAAHIRVPAACALQGCAYAVSMPGGSTSVRTYSASSSTDADDYYRDSYTPENSETFPRGNWKLPGRGGD
jgi:hypothetical protein